jgi:hypothetical protein
VRLSGEERERLETLIPKGKGPARRVLKARILLKADVSEGSKGWSDNWIIEALETSPSSMVYRTRKQLVEDGFEAVLSRKPRAMPAIARIFDGEKEAKLIVLACSSACARARKRARKGGKALSFMIILALLRPHPAEIATAGRGTECFGLLLA